MCAQENTEAFLEAQLVPGLEMLRRMVEINSFTANREGVNRLGHYTADCFRGLGFQSQFVPSTNPAWGDHLVMSRPGRTSKSIAMISHLDTVFPPDEERRNDFRWQVEGGRIYGPGTHDIKGGTLMMWLVLSALQASSPELFKDVTWWLFWNAAEECSSPDFGQVCRSRLGADTLAALVFEAENRSGSDRLMVVARKGRLSWRVVARGRGAHSGGRHPGGANAVVQLANIVSRIARLTDYSRGLTFNVATVAGGTVLNRVPHEAFAEGEFRAFDGSVYDDAKAALLALGGTGDIVSPEDGYACRVEVEVLSETPPWPRNAGSLKLFDIWRQAGSALGLPVQPEQRGGLSDGNLLWDFVPTLDGLGPWGENDHCSERSADGSKLPEYVEVSSFVRKALLNCHAIRLLWENAGGGPARAMTDPATSA